MKRIIFNTDSLIMGGAEKLALQYVKELAKDYEVYLLINEDNGEEGNVLIKDIPNSVRYSFVVDKGIMENLNKYRKLKKEKKYNFWYRLRYNYYLKRRRESYRKNIEKILKKENYDILIDFNCKIPKEIINDRTIIWLHLTLEGIKEKTKQIYEEKFSKAKKIIVINEMMKDEFISIFPKYKDKVENIYNFFDIENIREKASKVEELNTKERNLIQDKYIVSCCRLDRQKDVQTTIRAFKNLKDKYKIEEKFYIIGDGDERKELENLVKSLGIEKEIVFLGTQKNPYIWMKNAKMFIHSSHREGFGMVIVEAMITNGKVISSDCPVGPREILDNGNSGILVEVGNVKEMQEAIYKLLTDINFIKNIENIAKKRSMIFSKELNYKKIKNIIEN